MGTRGTIGVRGMKTSGNRLALPPGSLTEASNAAIPSKSMVTPRRGFMLQNEYAASSNGYIDGDSTDANHNRAKELFQWGTALYVNYTGDAGYRLASFATWATSPTRALVGSYAPPAPTVLRMKFAALAKSLYWTTDAGLYTVDAVGGTARAAGYRRPTIFFADGVSTYSGLTGNPNATGSWLAKDNAVAYRATYGHKDANSVIEESEASGRLVVVNPKDVVVATGSLVRTSNVVTATVTAHKFRVGDKLNLSSTDSSNFNQNNNVVTSTTATTIVWAETAADHTSGVDITLTSGTKSVQMTVGTNGGSFTAGDFIRLYRTDESAGEAIDPGDECYLAYERVITTTDASNGYVTITDTTPAGFLGDPLDSNANSGDGELGQNTRPPLCRDLCSWDGRLWGAQTTDVHRLRLRLLGTGSPNGLQSGDLLAINTKVFEAGANFNLYTQYLPTENVERTTYDMATYMPGSGVGISAHQEHDGDTGLGEVILEQATLASTMADGAGGAINAIYAATSRASAFGDALAATKAITAASTARTLTTTVTVRCTGHGFTAGEVIMLARAVTGSTDANFPVGLKTVATVVDADNFTYAESGSNATLSGGTPYYAYRTTYKSDNNTQGIRFSRQGIPEAWPLANVLGGLPDGAEVLRATPSGSGYSLLVFLKDSSIYRVSGEYPYTVRRLDDTASLVAADSLVAHSGKLFALTTQGLVAITEAGVGIVGADIENITRLVVNGIQSGALDASLIFATSYESERQYILSMPIEDEDHPGTISSAVGQGMAYNSLLDDYSRTSWLRTCGIVFRGRDRLVMGDTTTNTLRIERKALNFTDFADEIAGTAALTANATGSGSTWVLTFSAVPSGAAVGDAAYNVTRSQYALVTAKTSTTVTVAGAHPSTWLSTDSIRFYKHYQFAVLWAPDSGGAPGIEKRWREIQIHTGVFLAHSLTVFFANEKSTTLFTVTLTDSDFEVLDYTVGVRVARVAVPTGAQMCTTLTVGLLMSEAFSYFELFGISSTAEPVSERSGK
jgi:hypothetical protein